MATGEKYHKYKETLAESGNAGSDAWRLILSSTAPDLATDTTAASASELATGGGYTAGGVPCTVVSAEVAAGIYRLKLTAPESPTWTASDVGFAFRYVILYNLTHSQCAIVWDYGSPVNMSGVNGDTFTPAFDTTNGAFTIS